MSTYLSSWSKNVKSVPPDYILPEDKRPGGEIGAPVCKDIPVIDLSQLASLDCVDEIIQQIMKASMDLGMFQVINHGVSEKLMDETANLFKEFFNMPAEDKHMYDDEDYATNFGKFATKGFALFQSSIDGVKMWHDSARHICEPNFEDNVQLWPEKPTRYREVVRAYSMEVRKLSSKILDLICEGLGIDLGYFAHELSQSQNLEVHNYPPCPKPDLVLGVRAHTDPGLLTVLQQSDIYGLQTLKDGQWLGVEPIPHAFVIFAADQLEVISNGKLKSAQHRAVTNSNVARMSLVTFISPLLESIIEPEKTLVSASEHALFKPFQYKEYRYFRFANRQEYFENGTALDTYNQWRKVEGKQVC